MIVIKKYENRRLYNTADSRYVNLEDVAAMVRAGAEIQVVDAASGEDITRLVLIQIIAEDAKTPNSAFPLDMLRQMVIASGKLTQEGVLRYMKSMFDLYQNTYHAFTPAGPMDWLQMMMRPRAPQAAPSAQPAAEADASRAGEREIHSDVLQLQRRIEELEKMVAQTSGGAKRQKKTRSRKAK
jgi:polyhydroxyalkanoate synthesis repressor PhaR